MLVFRAAFFRFFAKKERMRNKWSTGIVTGVCVLIYSCSDEPRAASVLPQEEVKKIELTQAQKETAHCLDTFFTRMYNGNEFNGNVLIAKHDTVIFKKSYGNSDFKKNTMLSDSSLFQLASVSKTFTACLVLQLAEQKKINLESDVRKYLPDFPYENITVKSLLSHRSGLFNYIYFCADSCADKTKKLDNQTVYQMVCSCKPAPYNKPDQLFNYNNTNYMLLALIAEKVGGKNFKSLIKENIFDKCKMSSTFFADELPLSSNVCKGYTFSLREVEGDMFDEVWGDKGIYTTTGDLFLFEDAYFSGRLITPALLEQAMQPYSNEKKMSNYGYGWRMKFFNSPEKLIYHNGWWHGFRTALQRRLKDGTTIIILSNRLNKSVYHTWKVFNCIDGKATEVKEEEEE